MTKVEVALSLYLLFCCEFGSYAEFTNIIMLLVVRAINPYIVLFCRIKEWVLEAIKQRPLPWWIIDFDVFLEHRTYLQYGTPLNLTVLMVKIAVHLST